MARLKHYSVYLDPKSPQPYETAVFVPEGFNFWAFLFGLIWALFNRLWLAAFILFVIAVTTRSLFYAHILLPVSVAAVEIGCRVVLGMLASDLKGASLRKRGYVLADIVSGVNLPSSQQRYFDRVTASA